MKRKTLKKIFLSSIHQNAGKTTMCIGLLKALNERKFKTAFIKPVGQEVVNVGSSRIDKDSYLIGELYRTNKRFLEMSPVTVGRGYTEKYIFNPHKDRLRAKIEKSFGNMSKGKDAIVVEGTGHAGVGSVIDFSNADVAALLGCKVVMITEGGIGKSIDEITLNKALFELNKVEVIGVIVNKVRLEKYEKIKKILGRGLQNKGIKLLGIIPYEPLLKNPTVEQVQARLELKILSGQGNLHKRIKHNIVAAMEPHNMIQHLKDGSLVITSGDRVDNILAAVSSHLIMDGRSFQISGIILTGGLMPNPKILDLIKKSQIPILFTEQDTYTVAARMENLVFKIQKTDKDKILEATRLVKKYVDIDAILDGFANEAK